MRVSTCTVKRRMVIIVIIITIMIIMKTMMMMMIMINCTRVVQFKMTLDLPFENEATHRKMFIPNTTLKFT